MLSEELKFERIPPISDQRLLELARHVKPFCLSSKTAGVPELFVIMPPEEERTYLSASKGEFVPTTKWLRGIAYLWEASARSVKIEESHLYERIGSTLTYHSYGHPSLFKPSVAEVLAQLGAQLTREQLIKVMGFMLTSTDYHMDDGYHVAVCHLFGRSILSGNLVRGYETHNGSVYYENVSGQSGGG